MAKNNGWSKAQPTTRSTATKPEKITKIFGIICAFGFFFVILQPILCEEAVVRPEP